MSRLRKRILKSGQKALVFLVEDVSLLTYLAVFGFVVVVLGAIYAFLTPYGHGVGRSGQPLSALTVGDGIYFSIVTVSSLGYGDIHPIGASRVFACGEVLFGLAVMGIMVAKVTSRRLSYHVQRLFSSDAQKRLEDTAIGFDKCTRELARIMPVLGAAFQTTPGQQARHDQPQVLTDFRGVVGLIEANCKALSEYLMYEIGQGKYFAVAPPSSVTRVGENVDACLMLLGQLIISISPQARPEVLDRASRQRISEAIRVQRAVCSMIRLHATDQQSRMAFESVAETCARLPGNYFAIPEETQPDQVMRQTDQPQVAAGVIP